MLVHHSPVSSINMNKHRRGSDDLEEENLSFYLPQRTFWFTQNIDVADMLLKVQSFHILGAMSELGYDLHF